MWIKMELHGTKLLYVGVYYHLKESDEESLNQLENSLTRIGTNDEHLIMR